MEKSRNLSVAEYFEVIQREYLIADFRRKIYYSPKDKAYYTRVRDHKAEKIDDIAQRNGLISVRNSEQKFHEVWNELFNVNGAPKFNMTETDIRNYYLIGNEFSYNGEIWILDVVTDDALVLSQRNGKTVQVSRDEVRRIL